MNVEIFGKGKVECYNLGVYDKRETLRFAGFAESTMNKIADDGEIVIEVDSLDNILKDKPVDFVKMDIQGSELKALDGAKNIII